MECKNKNEINLSWIYSVSCVVLVNCAHPLPNPGLCSGIMNICFANGTNSLIRKQKAVNPWLIPAYAWGLRGGGAT